MLSAVGAGDVGQAAGHTGVEGLLPYPPAPVPGAGCARGVDPGVATQAQQILHGGDGQTTGGHPRPAHRAPAEALVLPQAQVVEGIVPLGGGGLLKSHWTKVGVSWVPV